MKERTFCIIKPDAVEQDKYRSIITDIRCERFNIPAYTLSCGWSIEAAEYFYKEHKGKDFFDRLVSFMSSGPLIMLVLEKENAVSDFRSILGDTDPQKAHKDSLRGKYGSNLPRNALHGSDSLESAAREIDFYINKNYKSPTIT